MRIWLVALLTSLVVGCGSGPAKDRALIWARSADSTTLDPAEIQWGEDAKITENIFETLVAFRRGSAELEPHLAKSWTFSPDGRTLTFELREGVRFHDGTPFDSGDVEFTFARLLDPNHPHKPKAVPYAQSFASIESVKADGPLRMVFRLKHPGAVNLYTLALFGAAIVSPEGVKSAGAEWPNNPVGTGPYRLTRWEHDKKIVLERFDGYWGAKPPIAKVIVVPVKSPQTALQKLKTGEVHVVDHPTLADIKPLQSEPRLKVELGASMNVCYLGFNLKMFPYSDPNFRRAVSLALDRRSLNNLAYYDLAEPAANIVPPAIWRGIAPTPEYERDLAKAREFLAKVKLDGTSIELIHPTIGRPYVPEPQRVAEWVKDQLTKIGLDVKLTGYDKTAFTEKTQQVGHPMYLLGWNADYPDPDNFFYPLLHGDNAGDLNASFFDDPEFNDAVKKAQGETDSARRNALYAAAYARYRDQLPTLPLVHVKQVVAMSKAVIYEVHPIEVRFYDARFAE